MFLIFALSVGSYIAVFCPISTGISPDDSTHYPNSLNTSQLVNPESSLGERVFSDPLNDGVKYKKSFNLSITESDQNTREKGDNLLNYLDVQDITRATSYSTPGNIVLTQYSLSYTPSAIGLWIARLFHLPLTIQVIFGRLFNLSFYVLVVFLALRLVPVKKTLFAAISLIATMIFLAANYSYDSFLYAMLLLGLTMTLRLRYSNDESIRTSQVLAILIIFTIGFSPKAIYVLLLGVMFIVPKCKFASKSDYAKYISSIFVFGFFSLATFVLPFFITGGSNVSDLRGGNEVNAFCQLCYVLQAPLSYFSILGNSLIEWLNINNQSIYMT